MTRQAKILETSRPTTTGHGIRSQIQTHEAHDKKTTIQFPLSTKSRYGVLQQSTNPVEMFTLPARQARPKISNKNIIFRSHNLKSSDPQNYGSIEMQTVDEAQKRATQQNRIMSNAIKHVEALDSKGQPSNPAAGQNQIAELIQKQDQKRNVAFLDLTSDLVQLNKQIL